MKTKMTYADECEALGTQIDQIKTLGDCCRDWSATKVRAVWNYRAFGLSIDDAKWFISRWTSRSFRYKPPGPDKYRIRDLAKALKKAKELWSMRVSGLNSIPEFCGQTLTWDNAWAKIDVAGRTIVVVRYEDCVWSENRNRTSRWPLSKTVTYRSYLIKTNLTPPSVFDKGERAVASLALNGVSLSYISEKSIEHNARGNWAPRVISELLGKEAAAGFVVPVAPAEADDDAADDDV